ncbi:MAG: hypothetical protein PVG66_04100 [Chromatiales bacterium]|jgi:hypothetical protein
MLLDKREQMRYRTLKNWDNPADLEGLVFFAQLLEELLFDYSLDTYKPSAMTSSSLCGEALSLINDIEGELIDKSNLNHVIEELTFSLRKDEIAKSLLDLDVETICLKLELKNNSLQEKRIVLQIIYSQLNPALYKKRAEEMLREAVKKGNEKNLIRSLTRNYVTTLIGIGYSTRYLYPSVRWAFHSSKKQIQSASNIDNFFDLVRGGVYKYVAIFKAAEFFHEIKDSCKEFEIIITDELEGELKTHAENKKYFINDGSTYLIVQDLEEMDVFSARNDAERRIETLSTLINLFHHKEIPSWEKKSLLINLDTNIPRLTNSAQNPMLMCSDNRAPDAALKLNKFINEFSLHEQHIFEKFFRATELHSLSLKNDSPENQLLNLWVGLETLAPSKLSRNKAKINNIIDSVLPFLTLSYLHTLTKRLAMDFKKWNVVSLNKHTASITGDGDREKLLKLLLLEENKEAKDALFSDLGEFYLLRNRAHYFSTTLGSTGKISKLLKTHWKRVDWQIRRIYRARNLIVHAGHTPKYIDVLIKNLHDYLDVVTNGIVYLASKGDQINTVDQAFKYSEIKYQEYIKSLDKSDVAIDINNIEEFLLSKKI